MILFERGTKLYFFIWNTALDDNYLDLVPLKDMKMLRTLTVSLADCEELVLEDVSFPTVTKPTFVCYNHCISIEWFLSLFPSLDYLNITVRKGIKSSGVKQLVEKKYPNLRSIHIHKSKLYSSIHTFIKHATENLNILNARSFVCYSSNEKGHPIDLTGLKLKKFHLQVFNKDTRDKGVVGHVTIKGASQAFLFFSPGERVLVCPDEDVYEKC